MRYTSLDDFLKDIPVHAAKHAAELRGHDTVIAVNTPQRRSVTLTLKDGQVTVAEGLSTAAACTVQADEQVLLDLINGSLSPMKALLFRKISVKGDMSQLLALARLV